MERPPDRPKSLQPSLPARQQQHFRRNALRKSQRDLSAIKIPVPLLAAPQKKILSPIYITLVILSAESSFARQTMFSESKDPCSARNRYPLGIWSGHQ